MSSLTATKPKLGFAGVGWIGKNRMKAIGESRLAEMSGAVDPDDTIISELKQEVPGLRDYDSFEAMLESEVDGVVIATPSALHARQALAAIRRGKAVFCQKPLGVNRLETAEVVEAARVHDVLLGVDYSYRYSRAMQQVKETIRSGELGEVYAIHLTFHNAYGPDKPWYYDTGLSGGGCLIDLGIHLTDLVFWVLGEMEVDEVSSRLFHKGKPLYDRGKVEDYAMAQFVLNDKIAVQLSCSWHLSAGKDAMIEARFYGEEGGATFRNVDGSFYDFVAEKHTGTTTQELAAPPDEWEGRAAVEWAERLSEGNRFDPAAYAYTDAARVIELIYQQDS